MDSFSSLDRPISNLRVSDLYFVSLFVLEIPILNANRVDPDQAPLSVESYQGLHSLKGR